MIRLRQRLRRTGRLRQRLRRTALAAAVALAIAWPARADVTDYLGQSVVSIRLLVDGRETADPQLSRLVDVRLAQPLSMRDIRESVLHLFATTRFDDVRVDAARQGTGVAVRFEMVGAGGVSGHQQE